MLCPQCQKELRKGLTYGVEVLECPLGCGSWVSRGKIDFLVATAASRHRSGWDIRSSELDEDRFFGYGRHDEEDFDHEHDLVVRYRGVDTVDRVLVRDLD